MAKKSNKQTIRLEPDQNQSSHLSKISCWPYLRSNHHHPNCSHRHYCCLWSTSAIKGKFQRSVPRSNKSHNYYHHRIHRPWTWEHHNSSWSRRHTYHLSWRMCSPCICIPCSICNFWDRNSRRHPKYNQRCCCGGKNGVEKTMRQVSMKQT